MRDLVVRSSASLIVFASLVSVAVGCSGNATREEVGADSERVSASSFTPTLSPSDVLSPDSPWYKDVSASPVASNSSAITSAMRFGHGAPMIDFSIKVMQINSATSTRTVQFNPDYTPDSDATPVPVPNGGALEDEAGYTCTQGGDCHLLVIDPTQRKLFELWSVNNTSADGSGTWSAADESVWLMDGHYGASGRGLGCTSADAAGLSVTAGIVGVREANAGQINHAIRFILPNSSIRKGKAYIAPATHGTTATSSAAGPAFGTRLRLRASFDESSVKTKGGVAMIRALKKYGMILADGGQDAFTAESDAMYASSGLSWNGVLGASDMSGLTPADFDVVDYDESSLGSGDDCARAPAPSTTPRDSGTSTPPSTGTTTPPSTGTTTPPSTGTTTPPSTGTTTPPSTGTTPPSTGTTTPPSTAGNLVNDGGFEAGSSSFAVWPGKNGSGDIPARAAKAITGSGSLEVSLADSNWVLSSSVDGSGTQSFTASATLRNDSAASTVVSLCAAIYDQSWNLVKSCSQVSLAPGQQTRASATYPIPSSTTAQMAMVYLTPADGHAATLAVDDVYAAYGAQ